MASVVTVFVEGGYADKLMELTRRRLHLQVDIVDVSPLPDQ